LLTLVSPMFIPSLSSSPLNPGAPSRVRSAITRDQIAYVLRNRRTPKVPCLTFHVQKRRKPFPVQAITVSCLNDDQCGGQSAHTPHSHLESRSSGVNFGFCTELCRTPSWGRAQVFHWKQLGFETDDRAATIAISMPRVRAWEGGEGVSQAIFSDVGICRGTGREPPTVTLRRIP